MGNAGLMCSGTSAAPEAATDTSTAAPDIDASTIDASSVRRLHSAVGTAVAAVPALAALGMTLF